MVHQSGTSDTRYGADLEPSLDTVVVADESSSLLGRSSSGGEHYIAVTDGRAGLPGSIGNLANTIIGSGMLTFPFAMASTGILPGVISCAFCGSVSAFGLYLLSLAARKAPHRRASFFAIAQMTFPRAAVFFDAAIAIKCFGVSVSYLIIIKSLMPSVVAALYHDLTSPDTNPPKWALSGHVWIVLVTIVLAPLALLRSLHSLRHASYVALFSVAYLVLVVVSGYFHPIEGTPAPGEIHLIHFSPNFVSTFPLQVFGFTCAQNLFPLYNELKSNTQKRMNITIGAGIGSALGIYELIAVFGYLTFGSKVGPNIIAMYPSTTLFIAIGQLAIVILVMLSYPLQVHPCRNCLDKLFNIGVTTAKPLAVQDGENDDEVDIVDDHGSATMSFFKHTVLTIAIILAGFTIAYVVDDLQIVLSFVGSTGSTTVSFILPGLFFWKLTRNDPDTSRFLNRAALALTIYGSAVFVFCLSYNIFLVVRPSESGAVVH